MTASPASWPEVTREHARQNIKVHQKVQTGRCWTASARPSSRGLGPGSLCACGWCVCAAAVAAAAVWGWAVPSTTGSTGWSVLSPAGMAWRRRRTARTAPPGGFWAPPPRLDQWGPTRCLGRGCAAPRGPPCVWSCSRWRGSGTAPRLTGWETSGGCRGWSSGCLPHGWAAGKRERGKVWERERIFYTDHIWFMLLKGQFTPKSKMCCLSYQ